LRPRFLPTRRRARLYTPLSRPAYKSFHLF